MKSENNEFADKIYKCDFCDKSYSKKYVLTAHIKRVHGIEKEKDKRKYSNCPICGSQVRNNFLGWHFEHKHNIKNDDKIFFIYVNAYANYNFSFIEKNIVIDYLKKLSETVGIENSFSRQFVSFYNSIIKMRDYDIEKDNQNFIETVLPWKLKHPSIRNSKEYCSLLFKDDFETGLKYYEKFIKNENPFTGHGGKLSPFSKDFVGYNGLNEEEKNEKIRIARKTDSPDRTHTQLFYWIKKGLTMNEARKMVHDRQSVFSKEKCVAKYGYEDGMKIWKERQERWQNTLNSKPYEEQLRILNAKVKNSKVSKPYSKIEHEFSSQLVSDEFKNVAVTPYAIPDICVGWKIIDFFGDYYHCNPKKYKPEYYNHRANKTAQEIWEKDVERISKLEHDGYIVKIVWESDYKSNKEKVINECKEFLKSE